MGCIGQMISGMLACSAELHRPEDEHPELCCMGSHFQISVDVVVLMQEGQALQHVPGYGCQQRLILHSIDILSLDRSSAVQLACHVGNTRT